MIKLFNQHYFIDFEELDKFLFLDMDSDDKIITEKTTETFNNFGNSMGVVVEKKEHIKHKEINGVKFELIRGFISDLGDEQDSSYLHETSVRFKLAFNTLIVYGILKKMDQKWKTNKKKF